MELEKKALTSKEATEAGTMLSLTRAQKATGKAHLTIQVMSFKWTDWC